MQYKVYASQSRPATKALNYPKKVIPQHYPMYQPIPQQMPQPIVMEQTYQTDPYSDNTPLKGKEKNLKGVLSNLHDEFESLNK